MVGCGWFRRHAHSLPPFVQDAGPSTRRPGALMELRCSTSPLLATARTSVGRSRGWRLAVEAGVDCPGRVLADQDIDIVADVHVRPTRPGTAVRPRAAEPRWQSVHWPQRHARGSAYPCGRQPPLRGCALPDIQPRRIRPRAFVHSAIRTFGSSPRPPACHGGSAAISTEIGLAQDR